MVYLQRRYDDVRPEGAKMASGAVHLCDLADCLDYIGIDGRNLNVPGRVLSPGLSFGANILYFRENSYICPNKLVSNPLI